MIKNKKNRKLIHKLKIVHDDYFFNINKKKEKDKIKNIKKKNWWKNKVFRNVCFYCKNIFEFNELTVDHIIPLSRGGKSTKGNLVPCCKKCNNKKRDYIPVEIKIDELNSCKKNYSKIII